MQGALLASNILNLFSVHDFGVYPFCCKITLEVYSMLPVSLIKIRYIL